MVKNISIESARALVQAESGFAQGINSVRGSFFTRPEVNRILSTNGVTPIDMLLANRDLVLQSPSLYNVLDKVRTVRTPQAQQIFPEGYDTRYADAADRNTRQIREIFANLELRDEFLRGIDERVRISSSDNIARLDRGEKVKKDIVIVGGGPLTSLTVSILAPYFNVTVITQDRSVGFPWRSRPIYINSSAEDDGTGARLPLLGGTTTPIVPKDMLNLLGSDAVAALDKDTLEITCSDNSKRRYISGIALGEAVAFNIGTQVSDYYASQKVLPERTIVNSDGTKTLFLQDANTGKVRSIDANAVLFLNGPGEETCTLEDQASRDSYAASNRQLDGSIKVAQKRIDELNRLITRERTLRNFDLVAQYERELRSIRSQKIPLPRVLSLSAIEKVLEYWTVDLQRDPNNYPLAPLFDSTNQIANVGNGDTGRTLSEFLRFLGPSRSYPASRVGLGRPLVTLYNEKATKPADYSAGNRRRYGDGRVVDERVLTVSNKVERVLARDDKALVFGRAGATIEEADYAFVSLGFKRTPLESILPLRGISAVKVTDGDGNVAARGDVSKNVYIGGSATGFRAASETRPSDFPAPLERIISGLEIRENTVALWVFGLLQERFAWTFARRLSNLEQAQRIAEFSTFTKRLRGRR